MPSRVAKTVKVFGGYPHREHRSKKGRRKKPIGESKIDPYFISKRKDEKRLMRKEEQFDDDPLPDIEELLEEKIPYHLTFPSKPKHPLGYPELVCENCGFKNQLNFNPIKETMSFSLADVICKRCSEQAYYKHYWRDGQLMMPSIFIPQGWLRDLVKTKKIRLTDLGKLYLSQIC